MSCCNMVPGPRVPDLRQVGPDPTYAGHWRPARCYKVKWMIATEEFPWTWPGECEVYGLVSMEHRPGSPSY